MGDRYVLDWTLKQQNQAAEPTADKYPTSHLSPLNCCLSFVLYLKKRGPTPKIRTFCFFVINTVIFNVWKKEEEKKGFRSRYVLARLCTRPETSLESHSVQTLQKMRQ